MRDLPGVGAFMRLLGSLSRHLRALLREQGVWRRRMRRVMRELPPSRARVLGGHLRVLAHVQRSRVWR